jgi:hypothetical protein
MSRHLPAQCHLIMDLMQAWSVARSDPSCSKARDAVEPYMTVKRDHWAPQVMVSDQVGMHRLQCRIERMKPLRRGLLGSSKIRCGGPDSRIIPSVMK